MNELVSRFGAKSDLDLTMLLIHGVIAATAFAILLLGRPTQELAFGWHGRLARWVLTAVECVIAARVFSGTYFTPVEPGDLLLNAFVLWQVWLVRGDMSVVVSFFRKGGVR